MKGNNDHLRATICRRLKSAICNDGRTIADIARAGGVSQYTLYDYTNGKPPRRTPSVAVLVKVARALGVSLDWLCGLDPEE